MLVLYFPKSIQQWSQSYPSFLFHSSPYFNSHFAIANSGWTFPVTFQTEVTTPFASPGLWKIWLTTFERRSSSRTSGSRANPKRRTGSFSIRAQKSPMSPAGKTPGVAALVTFAMRSCLFGPVSLLQQNFPATSHSGSIQWRGLTWNFKSILPTERWVDRTVLRL